MADAQASGACGSNIVWVQVPSPAYQTSAESAEVFSCSEEGNQAHAKHVFGFTRAYNEKIRSSEAAALRSSGIFESERGLR